jgi:hypothetical protein
MSEHTLYRGASVSTQDDVIVGEVDEVRPDHFQIITGAGESLWVPRSTVVVATEERVLLGFAATELDGYTTGDPGAPGAVPATSRHPAYIPGASPEDANDLADPNLPPEGSPQSRAR